MDRESKIRFDQAMINYVRIDAQQNANKQILNNYENAVCSEEKKCFFMCCSNQCKGHAIVCANADCKCYKRHCSQNVCSMVNPKMILKKIQQLNHNSPQILDYIDIALQKLIDQISQFRTKLENKVKSWGVTGNVKQFLQISKKGQFKQLTGQTMSKVLEQLNNQSQEQKLIYDKNLQKQVKNKWIEIERLIKQVLYSFENYICQFVKKNPRNPQNPQKKTDQNKDFPKIKEKPGCKIQ